MLLFDSETAELFLGLLGLVPDIIPMWMTKFSPDSPWLHIYNETKTNATVRCVNNAAVHAYEEAGADFSGER
jgi:hypothetical protein